MAGGSRGDPSSCCCRCRRRCGCFDLECAFGLCRVSLMTVLVRPQLVLAMQTNAGSSWRSEETAEVRWQIQWTLFHMFISFPSCVVVGSGLGDGVWDRAHLGFGVCRSLFGRFGHHPTKKKDLGGKILQGKDREHLRLPRLISDDTCPQQSVCATELAVVSGAFCTAIFRPPPAPARGTRASWFVRVWSRKGGEWLMPVSDGLSQKKGTGQALNTGPMGGPCWLRFVSNAGTDAHPWALTGEEGKSKIEGSVSCPCLFGGGHPTDTAKKHQTLINNMAWIWGADSRWRWGLLLGVKDLFLT